MQMSPLHATDFYKIGHRAQYPEGTTLVYSNFTCRSDKLAPVLPDFDHKAVFFGLQGLCKWLLQDLWNENFFWQDKEEVIEEYQRRVSTSLGAASANTEHIAALHDLGYLPIEIKALPEGVRVPMRVPVMTIRNTLPDYFWLTNYLETQISAELWKPITSATIAYEFRRLLDKYADITGAPKAFVPWQGHDFSARGMSGIYDAAATGAGHLLSFTGTDTVAAIDYLENYYAGNETFVGGSVPASEHSIMCMGGQNNEIETFRRLISDVYPSGVVSIVSDTWDFWEVVTQFAATLRQEILARTPDTNGNAKVVFRPDSGDPVKIIAGDPDAEPGTPEFMGAVECLWNIFGGTETGKGYRELDSHVGLIYGDSITLPRAVAILSALEKKKFASSNIVFGIGSFTYQHVTRDSFGCAVKATFGVVNGEDRILSKAPKTDSGTKFSAAGLLRVEMENGEFVLHERQTREQEAGGLLQTVFSDGAMGRDQTLGEIRGLLLGGA